MKWEFALLLNLAFVSATHHGSGRGHRKGCLDSAVSSKGMKIVDGVNTTASRTSTEGYNFLTNQTEQYLVTSLPEVSFEFGELYSGSISMDADNSTNNSSLFFMFKPASTAVDEVVVYLNGGPGCSSLTAFMQENGPISWQPGTFAPVQNPYGWSNLTNMLWVDQPVGTGFSQGPITATSQEEIAADFVRWFKNWQRAFGISNYKIYLAGESYAGRYVPYIGSAMLDANDAAYFDLKGSLLYSPTIGSFMYAQEQIVAYPFIASHNNLFNFNQTQMATMESMHLGCGYQNFTDTYLTFPPPGYQLELVWNSTAMQSCAPWNYASANVFNINPCFNPYAINLMCPLLYNPTGTAHSTGQTTAGQTPYFDRSDVKAAIHAPNITWEACAPRSVFVGSGGPENKGDTSADPIQSVLPRVIEATNRVLVGTGTFDFVVISNGTLLAIQNMTWGGELGFQTAPNATFTVEMEDLMYVDNFAAAGLVGWDGAQGRMGTYHYERGLMFVETMQAGHMVAQFQPRAAFKHLQWVLGRIDTF